MSPEKLFHELLGLGLNWKVEECEFKREEGVVCLRIRETEHLWEIERCPESGARVKCYDHVEEMVWRHLNVFEHKCEIRCRLPRGRCEGGGKVYRVTPPWEGLSKHFTKAFEAMALLLLREMPVAAVGRLIDEHDTRLPAHLASRHERGGFTGICLLPHRRSVLPCGSRPVRRRTLPQVPFPEWKIPSGLKSLAPTASPRFASSPAPQKN